MLNVTSVSIAPSGKLDLADNAMRVSYSGASPAASIASYIATGYTQGQYAGLWHGCPLADHERFQYAFYRLHGPDPVYFQREARRNFRVEVIFFLILAAILAGPFIQGARFIIHFLHLLAA